MKYNKSAIVAASTSTSTNSPTEDEQTTNTNAYYVHTSHLDTPLALTNDNGDIVWQASYTPFGEINITLDTLPEHFTARFPGQYSDNDTGFYYNYFRDYDPELGRYIQSDPIGLGGGINTYGYVGGNPVSYIDPLGLDAQVTIWQPVGWGSSSFGHVSTSINGTTWSWGPNGMTKTPTSDYWARNDFRSGVTSNIPLTPEQTNKLADYLNQNQGWYGALGNNCAAPVQRGFSRLGIDTGDVVLPVSLGNKLLDLGVVNGVVFQSPAKPSTGSSGPWAK